MLQPGVRHPRAAEIESLQPLEFLEGLQPLVRQFRRGEVHLDHSATLGVNRDHAAELLDRGDGPLLVLVLPALSTRDRG